MARFNKEHGDIDTELIRAEDECADIHPNKVREALADGTDITPYIVPAAAEHIRAKYEETRRR